MDGWNPSGPRTPIVSGRVTIEERLTLLEAARRYLGQSILNAIIATGIFVVVANAYEHWVNKPGTWQERQEPRKATKHSNAIEKLPS
jgi:hypothetical protein